MTTGNQTEMTLCNTCGKMFYTESERHICDDCYANTETPTELFRWRETPLGKAIGNAIAKAIDEKTKEAVDHPSHYTYGKIEVIDFIEDKEFPYHLGNVVKYISRAGKKDPCKTIEDLKKARWYLDRYIGILEKNNG